MGVGGEEDRWQAMVEWSALAAESCLFHSRTGRYLKEDMDNWEGGQNCLIFLTSITKITIKKLHKRVPRSLCI